MTMKNMVPSLAPGEIAERSPYPIVEMDIMLYHRLSKMPTSRPVSRSKKKKVRVFPARHTTTMESSTPTPTAL
jgi:hypothetical protein